VAKIRDFGLAKKAENNKKSKYLLPYLRGAALYMDAYRESSLGFQEMFLPENPWHRFQLSY
jgi:hypothetical protein